MKTKDRKRKKLIEESILKDTTSRASLVSYIFAGGALFYGFTSLGFLRKFAPDISMWSNIWPRIAFNTIPFILLGIWISKTKSSPRRALILWFASFGLIFQGAAWINVWPLILDGNHELFPYVHAANIILLALGIIVVSPPTRLLVWAIGAIGVTFVAPLFAVAVSTGDKTIINLIVGDILHILAVSSIVSIMIYRIRKRLARLELERQGAIKKYLGTTVSEAIFEDRPDLLETRTVDGFVLAMDVRGYTDLVKHDDQEQVATVMNGYHRIVSTAIGTHGGYIHKSMGDGHLISFGVLDAPPDLSDLPHLAEEEAEAQQRRNKDLLITAVKVVEEIIAELQILSKQALLDKPLTIGAAIDFGEVQVQVIGDDHHRSEFDVYGKVINRTVRLETHSKHIGTLIGGTNSLLVISPEAADHLELSNDFFVIETKEEKVRDFEEIEWVLIKKFPQNTYDTAIAA